MDFALAPVDYAALPGWEDDDPSSLFAAMDRCLAHMTKVKHYKTGSLGIRSEILADIFGKAQLAKPASAAEARAFMEKHFRPFRIRRENGGAGFVTAFYEPEVEVSEERDEIWRYPFYRRPDDLIDLDDESRPASLDRTYMFGRQTPNGVEEYFDRQAIDQGYLENRGLEIAWARSRIDVFFAHVQGAARLLFRDGSVRRITYAAKAGHGFTGIGRHLIDIGEIPEAEISMGSIRAWLGRHPHRQDDILWQNRSYIFFRQAPVDDSDLGPIAAAKVALAPMRSLAVDRTIHTFSSIFYIVSDSLTHLTEGRPFQRSMMALDTGSAIVGPARGDIFTGSGDVAGDRAGSVRNEADFYILVPCASVPELAHGR